MTKYHRTSVFRLVVALGAVAAACSPESPSNPPATGGSPPATGGASSATGGASSATGGTSSATGGTSSATGGTSSATGGTSSATGGSASGGRLTGGSAAGGAASGGRPTGGSSTGGTPATGGTPTGGKATGGTSTGGTPTGGKATGGTSTGGTPTGGKATGGNATGGNATGGNVTKFIGNITTRDAVDPSGLTYHKYWDQITPENAGKWGSVQSTPSSSFNWATLDRIYSYTQTNNIVFKQHCFVWGAQQPTGTPTLAQVENWIKSFCQRYPNTKVIDVVNEPPPHTTPNYTSNLGAGEGGTYPWIKKAFKLARQYCGSAVLILNDYNNVELTGDRNHTVDIVKDIKANGAPIDAIGCQSHGLKGASASTLQTNLAYLNSQTSLPIYITEFDIDNTDDNGQLSSYQTLFPVFLNTSYVHGVTVWGWIYGSTWETGSGIVRGTTPRPAMTWLMQQLGRPNPPN
jgi:endo-1,4-beta-xylanase